MQRPTIQCLAVDQTTRTIPIVWIVFNNFTGRYGFAQFLEANLTYDALINRML